MPFTTRELEPKYCTYPDTSKGNINNRIFKNATLQTQTQVAISDVVEQISNLSILSSTVLGNLAKSMKKLDERTSNLIKRIEMIQKKAEEIMSQPLVEVGGEQESFVLGLNFSQQLLAPHTLEPDVIKYLESRTVAPPPLHLLDGCRSDDQKTFKKYSDPAFFFEHWYRQMQEQQKSRQAQNSRGKERAIRASGSKDTLFSLNKKPNIATLLGSTTSASTISSTKLIPGQPNISISEAKSTPVLENLTGPESDSNYLDEFTCSIENESQNMQQASSITIYHEAFDDGLESAPIKPVPAPPKPPKPSPVKPSLFTFMLSRKGNTDPESSTNDDNNNSATRDNSNPDGAMSPPSANELGFDGGQGGTNVSNVLQRRMLLDMAYSAKNNNIEEGLNSKELQQNNDDNISSDEEYTGGWR